MQISADTKKKKKEISWELLKQVTTSLQATRLLYFPKDKPLAWYASSKSSHYLNSTISMQSEHYQNYALDMLIDWHEALNILHIRLHKSIVFSNQLHAQRHYNLDSLSHLSKACFQLTTFKMRTKMRTLIHTFQFNLKRACQD